MYHINRLPSATLHFVTPYEKLFNHKPNYNMLRCFGCCCYPYLRDYNRHKFDYHSSKCIFVWYSPSHKGYKFLHPSGKVYIARHVFDENTFPYSNIYESQKSNFCSHILLTPQQVYHLTTLSVTPFFPDGSLTNPDSVSSNCSGSDHLVNSASTQYTIPEEPIKSHILPVQPTSSPSTSPNNQPILISSNIQTSIIIQQPSSQPNTHQMITRSKAGIFKPKVYTTVLEHKEPDTVHEALHDPNWFAAMKNEFDALTRNNTGSLVPRTSDQNIVGNKWV